MSNDVATKIDRLFSTYPKRKYPKGQIVVFAGENPGHVFYITKGKVREYDISYRGDEIVMNLFKPPAFFPMAWVINKSKNSYFYKTESETEMHIIPADEALQILKDNPDVMLDLIGRLYRGLDGLLGRMVHLMSGTAKQRLLYELVVECRRFGEKQDDGSVMLHATEADFAARSGLTRETVSREMHSLKADGLISIDAKSMRVHDLRALEEKLRT